MPFDKFHDMEEITDARRKAIAKSIRTIEVAELKKLGEQIFDSLDHPWRQTFFQLIEEPGATFYHGGAGEGVIFLYDPSADKGLWCLPGSGIGPLSARGCQIMKEAINRR
jgi:hypothetical protein